MAQMSTVKMLMGMGGERIRFVKKIRTTPRIPLTMSPVNEKVSPRVKAKKATNAITSMSMMSSIEHRNTQELASKTPSSPPARTGAWATGIAAFLSRHKLTLTLKSRSKGRALRELGSDPSSHRVEAYGMSSPRRSGKQAKSEGL